MAVKKLTDKQIKARAADARRTMGERMSDFRPRIVTQVVRQEMVSGEGWRVIMMTYPPTLLAEGVSEAEAIEIQEAKRAELSNLLPS